MTSSDRNVDQARDAWGDAPPEWIQRLAHACDQASQTDVAERLNLSKATVSMLLSKKYLRATVNLEQRILQCLPPVPRKVERSNAKAALECWGAPLPDYVDALATACDASSQAEVARRLRVSPTVVSQFLACKYPGRVDPLIARIQGELMGHTVECPALGATMNRLRCVQEQFRTNRPLGNPFNRYFMEECPRCEHRIPDNFWEAKR